MYWHEWGKQNYYSNVTVLCTVQIYNIQILKFQPPTVPINVVYDRKTIADEFEGQFWANGSRSMDNGFSHSCTEHGSIFPEPCRGMNSDFLLESRNVLRAILLCLLDIRTSPLENIPETCSLNVKIKTENVQRATYMTTPTHPCAACSKIILQQNQIKGCLIMI